MLLRFLLISLWLVAPLIDYPSLEGNVTKDVPKVDFTWHSQVEPYDERFKITNFIRNNSDGPLSVSWEDAGISCIGVRNLKPGDTDYGTSGEIVYKPYWKGNSLVKYDATLSSTANVSVYIDEGKLWGKRQSRITEYERQDKNGIPLFKIQTTSVLDTDQRSTEITLRVVGGLNLLLPPLLGKEVKKLSKETLGKGWKLSPNTNNFEFGIDTNKFIADWFIDSEPFSPNTSKNSGYLVLSNQMSSSNGLSLTLTGAKWDLSKVRMIAFNPSEDGAIGFAADLYLPK